MKRKNIHAYSKLMLMLMLLSGAMYLAYFFMFRTAPFAHDASNPLTLRLWHYYNGRTKEAFDRQIMEFNNTEGKRLGIVVKPYTMGEVSRLAQAVQDAVANNQPQPPEADKFAVYRIDSAPFPDIFATYSQSLHGLSASLLELSNQLPPEKLVQFRPEMMADGYLCPPTRPDDIDAQPCGLYIFPTAKSTEVLYINKTAWDAFATATDTDLLNLSTWEGIKEVAKRYHDWTDSLTPTKGDGKALFRFDAPASFVSALYAQHVGRENLPTAPLPKYMIEALTEHGMAVPPVLARPYPEGKDKDIARLIWDFYHVPFVTGHFGMQGRFCSDDVKTGTIIAYIGSSAGALYFPTSVEMTPGQSTDISAIVMPYPSLAGRPALAIRQGAGFSVVAGDSIREHAAIIFLSWFTARENNIAFALDTGYLPVTTGTLDETTKRRMAVIPSTPAQHAKHTPEDKDYPYTVAGLAALTALEMSEQGLLADSHVEDSQHLMTFWNTFLPEQVEAALRERDTAEQHGIPRAEALRNVLSEQRFEQWYLTMQAGMTQTLQPAP